MQREEIKALIDRVSPEVVIETLSQYVTPRRQARIEEVLEGRLPGIQVAIEDPYDPHNAAAVVRSAEVFGASAVHVVRASRKIMQSKGVTSGTSDWVDIHHYHALEPCFDRLRAGGMRVAAACVDGDVDLEAIPVDRPLCLLLGNEHAGLTDEAKASAHLRYRIPMFGFAESLNLSVAAAISLYDITRRRRGHLGRSGGLDDEARLRTRALYFAVSVDKRLLRGLLGPGTGAGG